MTRAKITVVGAGHVGCTTAQHLALRDYADIVLLDIAEGLAKGKALDINHGAAIAGYGPEVTGTNRWADSAGSDVVVITASSPRLDGMRRFDLLAANARILAAVTRQALHASPDAILVVVSNPVDPLCSVVLDAAEIAPGRVVGMAGILDSARMRTFLAWELGVSARDVRGFVLGDHGDGMVPVLSRATAAGVPVTELLSQQQLEAIDHRTRHAGAEIIDHLRTGISFYAPSLGIAEIVDSILLDQKRVLPCSVHPSGQYGIAGISLGLPVTLGRRGVEEIHEPPLTPREFDGLQRSADTIRGFLQSLRDLEQPTSEPLALSGRSA